MVEKVFAYRTFSMLRVNDPGSSRIRKAIHNEFVVHRRVSVRQRGRTSYETIVEPCYESFDDKDGGRYYVLGYGFLRRLIDLLSSMGVELVLRDAKPAGLRAIPRFTPDKHLLSQIEWRDNQSLIIDDMLSHDVGQYVAATGSGKSFIIRKLCGIFPKAKFLITTYSQSVLKDLWTDVSTRSGVNAGLYCSSKKHTGRGRVQFCSIGCLDRYTDEEWDFLILDEKHECATIKRIQPLLAVPARRAYAFSANHEDRADNADPWLEAIFGDNRVQSTYGHSVANGDIVPINVNWVRCDIDRFPDLNPSSGTFERNAFWRNEERNELIAEIARARSANKQTLVYAKTLEHVYVLRKLLNCPVAHAEPTKERWLELRNQGLVEPDEDRPTRSDLEEVKRQFEEKEIDLAICNSVWRRGVNFPYLHTLIRADGGTSHQDSTQIPGRLTRLSKGKKSGELIDFIDEFHDSCRGRSSKRKRSYEEIGYTQKPWKEATRDY